MQDAKYRQKVAICEPSYNFVGLSISSQLRHLSTIGKKLVKQQYLLQMSHSMLNFGLLANEIDPVFWGTPDIFSCFRVLAALLHGSQVVSISQTLWRWTEGTIYVRQAAITLGIGPHSSC